MKETLPPCSSGSSLEENPTGSSHGTQQQEGAQQTLREGTWTLLPFQLFAFIPIFASSFSSQSILSSSLLLSSFPSSVLSLLALSDSLGVLWKESPERAPEVSKVPGNNLDLACLLPVPLSLESSLGQEDPNSHHHACSLLAAMAPWQVLHLWEAQSPL